MAYQWKIGDKAVCIDPVPSRATVQHLEQDKIYEIEGFNDHKSSGILGFYLKGVPNKGHNWDGYGSKRFRPVLPDKHEPATDAEFLKLMGKAKAASRQVQKV